VHFGAKVLILDEPTAALGVKQSGVVLKYIIQARERGLGVIFITHNPHHAYPVGDRFLLLNRGASIGNYEKNQVTRDELTGLDVDRDTAECVDRGRAFAVALREVVSLDDDSARLCGRRNARFADCAHGRKPSGACTRRVSGTFLSEY